MIILILIFGLAYRLISLNQSLWLDEAISAQTIQHFSFWQLITEFPKFDLHPPGHYLLLWLWGHVFGFSEVSLRFPSVLMGVATIFVVFLVGRNIGGKKVGLIAAWLLAINPLHLYYSQEARMYGMATFLVLLNFYYFQRLLKGKFSWGYVFSAMLVLTCDYVAYFSFLGQLVIISWWYRDRIKLWFLSLIPSGILFGVWSPIFLTQLVSGSGVARDLPVWQKVVGGFDVKSLGLVGVKTMLGRISLENKFWYTGVVSMAGAVYLIAICRAFLTKKQQVKEVLAMMIIPVIVAWLGSLVLPIFSYFRVLFVVPFVMIVLAIGLNEWKRWGVILTVVICLISLISGGVYLSQPRFQREDWRGVVRFLSQTQSSSSAVILESNGSLAPFDYYNTNQMKPRYGLKRIPAKTNDDIELDINNLHRIFLVEYLVDITDPDRLLIKNLINHGWTEVKVYDFQGVGFVREWVK